LRDKVEEVAAAATKLQAGRRSRSSILLGFLLWINFYGCFLLFDLVILRLSNRCGFFKLAFEARRHFVGTKISNDLAKRSHACEVTLRIFIPILVQQLASHIGQTQSCLEIGNQGFNHAFDLAN